MTEQRSTNHPPHPASDRKARVLLVDDHPILVEGLTTSLNSQPDLLVCGWAATARDALQAVEIQKPDLVVVDISLEGSSGIDLVKDLAQRHPQLPVLVLSTHDESLYAERSLRAGAKGFIMKREPVPKLVEAIRKVLRGGIHLSETATARMFNRFGPNHSGPQKHSLERLTDRELEILELVGRGFKTREIAENLHLSMKTVQAHREHIKEKLGLDDGLSLMRFAVNWVEAEGRSGADEPITLG